MSTASYEAQLQNLIPPFQTQARMEPQKTGGRVRLVTNEEYEKHMRQKRGKTMSPGPTLSPRVSTFDASDKSPRTQSKGGSSRRGLSNGGASGKRGGASSKQDKKTSGSTEDDKATKKASNASSKTPRSFDYPILKTDKPKMYMN